MSCNCNQITCGCCGNESAQQVCGEFDINTDTPDLGQCSPYRVKLSCSRPTKPDNPCNDTGAYAEYRPDENPKFVIIATIFDENCLPIQDENGAPIMGQY